MLTPQNINPLLIARDLLYLGPESIMPLASVLAAIVGVLLILWRYIITFLKKIISFIYGKIMHKSVPEPYNLDLDDED